MATGNAFGGRVVFDHLPKTAGQAVNAWLRAELGESCVTTNLIGEHRALIHQYGGDYSVISGHVSFSREGLDPRYQYITCLREPIDRAVSWLFFVTKNHTRDQLQNLWLETSRFVETEGDVQGESIAHHLKNPYVEHFASIHGEANKTDEQKLAAALEAVEQFDVWGIYEDMPGFMNEVAVLLGLNAPQALPRVNLTQSRPAVAGISTKLRQCLESLNALDLAFYRELSQRYQARSKAVQSLSFVSPWSAFSQSQERTFIDPAFRLMSASLMGSEKVERGQVLEFSLEFSLVQPVELLEVGIHIFDEDRRRAFGTNTTLLEKKLINVKRGTHRVQYHLVVDLPEGAYTAGFAFAEPGVNGVRELAWFDRLVNFSVTVPRPQACVGYSSMPVAVSYWQVSESVKGLIEDFSGRVTVPAGVADVMVDHTFNLPCLLHSASPQLWAGSAANPLHLSYHWHDANGDVVVFDGERTALAQAGLGAGEVVEVSLKVLAPAAPGRYRLTVTLMQEGVCWFEDRGFEPAVMEVHVVSSQQLASTSIASVMQQSGVAFGTSGARGLASAMTDEVCFAYTCGFLQHMASVGEFAPGMSVALAGDLRPSSPRILSACCAAIRAQGGVPVFCGFVPSPALALYAYGQGIPSLMVTGSHIPDDRNGIKFNRAAGEVLKADELGIKAQQVSVPVGMFDESGALLAPPELPAVLDVTAAYVQRYLAFVGDGALQGMRVGVYQHSSVGRDVLVTLLQALGADVVALGRSATFVPVDTEAVRPEDVQLARAWAAEHNLDAIVSTDGDADRPLIADERGEWLRGDVLGVLCARFLGAQCVATPVSSNTALEKSGWFEQTVRTRIGSPYVIEAMQHALQRGDAGVCGYEANGGFLLASAVHVDGRTLAPLPTRDAVLPMVAVLVASRMQGCSVSDLLSALPKRFTHSDRIQNFPTELSQTRLAALQAGPVAQQLQAIEDLLGYIAGAVKALDATDGLRVTFVNEEVIHLRPSGNAPELRCYTEAATPDRAAELNASALKKLAGWRD
jgi:phosphomannomutase